eukprot:scaffold27696_cov135-Isochrysis_galbana.AAC.1
MICQMWRVVSDECTCKSVGGPVATHTRTPAEPTRHTPARRQTRHIVRTRHETIHGSLHTQSGAARLRRRSSSPRGLGAEHVCTLDSGGRGTRTHDSRRHTHDANVNANANASRDAKRKEPSGAAPCTTRHQATAECFALA